MKGLNTLWSDWNKPEVNVVESDQADHVRLKQSTLTIWARVLVTEWNKSTEKDVTVLSKSNIDKKKGKRSVELMQLWYHW